MARASPQVRASRLQACATLIACAASAASPDCAMCACSSAAWSGARIIAAELPCGRLALVAPARDDTKGRARAPAQCGPAARGGGGAAGAVARKPAVGGWRATRRDRGRAGAARRSERRLPQNRERPYSAPSLPNPPRLCGMHNGALSRRTLAPPGRER
jgi:hypothetical protein